MAPVWPSLSGFSKLAKVFQGLKPQRDPAPKTSTNRPSASLTGCATISSTGEQSTMIEQETSGAQLDEHAGPRIFALVVAIDRYRSPNIEDLRGCKNDGKRVVDYLKGMLGVPSSQISFLANKKATKQEIINQFETFLIENSDIQRGDAIVFFFAGHGSRLEAPEGWLAEGNKVETLCSYDYRTIGDDGHEIWGIFDYTIDALMRELASVKGDNIVAILDCCHSGGLSRAETGLRPRFAPPPPYPLPADLDREIWNSAKLVDRAAHSVIHSGFQYKAMASHVLLAACRPGQSAYENPFSKNAPGGLFTSALMECLCSCSLRDTTYAMLHEKLGQELDTTLNLNPKHKDQQQHPQCEGTNKDRLLFSVNKLRDGRTTFRVTRKEERLYVSAGSIHGVDTGTVFTVKSSTQTFILKAKEVEPFRSLLEGHYNGVTDAEAVVMHWHHPTLRIHASADFSNSTHVTIVPHGEPADIAIRGLDSGKWMLERFDPLISHYADRSVHFDAHTSRMNEVFEAIANFNFYLYRSDGVAAGFAENVNVRLHRIEQDESGCVPVGEDLLDVPSSSHSGIDVKQASITELEPRYGFTLENFSEVCLFPYVFYFDPSDYSIQAWYAPPSSAMLAPLDRVKEDGSPSLLSLGYGAFGTDPIEFYLPPDRNADSGFLRVFLTTAYVDMTHVAQPSIDELSSSRGTQRSPNISEDTWACKTLVLTCKREEGVETWSSDGQ